MALSSVGAQTLTPRHWGLGQRNAHASREGTCEGRGAKGFILQQVWRDWGGEGERKEASAQDNCTSFHSSWEAHRTGVQERSRHKFSSPSGAVDRATTPSNNMQQDIGVLGFPNGSAGKILTAMQETQEMQV